MNYVVRDEMAAFQGYSFALPNITKAANRSKRSQAALEAMGQH